jgi:hypothetical protein
MPKNQTSTELVTRLHWFGSDTQTIVWSPSTIANLAAAIAIGILIAVVSTDIRNCPETAMSSAR